VSAPAGRIDTRLRLPNTPPPASTQLIGQPTIYIEVA
jgi:hypothetical protein